MAKIKTNNTGGEPTPTANAAIDRLLGDDAVSSQFTNLEEILTKSAKASKSGIRAAEAAQESGEASILGSFGREIDTVREGGVRQVVDATESRRGFATNTTLLKNIATDTRKRVDDLEQRKQELLLQNDHAAASAIAQIQLQALSFEQDATQKVFSNLLGLASFEQQKIASDRSFKLQERSQDFNERSQINSIALEFGLPVVEGETLDSIVGKAAPLATQERNLELQQMRANIALANANANKVLRGEETKIDGETLDFLSGEYADALAAGDTERAQSVLDSIAQSDPDNALRLSRELKQTSEKIRDEQFTNSNLRETISTSYAEALQAARAEFSKKGGNPTSERILIKRHVNTARRILQDQIDNNQLLTDEQREFAEKTLLELKPNEKELIRR